MSSEPGGRLTTRRQHRGAVRLSAGLVIALVVLAVAAVTVAVVAARSRAPGCGYALPPANLSNALRSQGGFDQVYGSSDINQLKEVAQRAATASGSALIGTTALRPVSVRARDGRSPDALVVPLRSSAGPSDRPIRGAVVFLSDCSGGLHFDSVSDLGSTGPAQFPEVDQASAEARLGNGVTLVYGDDPLHPIWRNAAGATLLAQP